MTDEEALQLARQGREEGFRALYDRYSGSLYRLALSLLRDRALAEDALQEALTSGFRSLSTFRGDCRLKTWFYRIVYHASLRQKKCRQNEISVDVLPEEMGTGMEPGRESSVENRLDVETILNRMPEKDRYLLVMAYWDDLSGLEIAEILGINANHVKILLFRARARFAQLWGKREATELEKTA